MSQKAHEQLVDRRLNALGTRSVVPAKPKNDLWSLHPWRHPTAVWRRLFGAETDTLVRSGTLVQVRMESVPHPEHPDAGRVLDAHPVSDGEFYGVSRLGEIPSRSLSATDLDGLELAAEQLRLYLRSRLGIASGGMPWNGQELLELGVMEAGDQRLYVTYAQATVSRCRRPAASARQ